MISKLAELAVKYDLSPHSALVRHMQFSPDGKFLATAGWDKSSVVFRVGVSTMPSATQNFLNFHSRHLPPTIYWHMLKGLWVKLHGRVSSVSVRARLILLDNLGHLQAKLF
jgi:WD40 repeat protein